MEKRADHLLLEEIGINEVNRIIIEWFDNPIRETSEKERRAGTLLLGILNNPIDTAFFGREKILEVFLNLAGYGTNMYFISSENPTAVKIPPLPEAIAGDGVLLYNLARSERRNNG